MANNRLYLKCSCGAELFIGKRFDGGYYWTNYGKLNQTVYKGYVPQDDRPLEDRLNEFYQDHEWCGGTLDHFTLEYEETPDWEADNG